MKVKFLPWLRLKPRLLDTEASALIRVGAEVKGWRSGESACLSPMCPGLDSLTRHHMWAEFVGSLLYSRGQCLHMHFPFTDLVNIGLVLADCRCGQ